MSEGKGAGRLSGARQSLIAGYESTSVMFSSDGMARIAVMIGAASGLRLAARRLDRVAPN
jgi:hypothetical protein